MHCGIVWADLSSFLQNISCRHHSPISYLPEPNVCSIITKCSNAANWKHRSLGQARHHIGEEGGGGGCPKVFQQGINKNKQEQRTQHRPVRRQRNQLHKDAVTKSNRVIDFCFFALRNQILHFNQLQWTQKKKKCIHFNMKHVQQHRLLMRRIYLPCSGLSCQC